MKRLLIIGIIAVMFLGCNSSQKKQENDVVKYPKAEKEQVEPKAKDTKGEQPLSEDAKEVAKALDKQATKKPAEKTPAEPAKPTKKVADTNTPPIIEDVKPPKEDPAKDQAAPKKEPAKKDVEPKKTEKYYYLRIISLKLHDYHKVRVHKLAKFLKGKGYKAEARKSSDPTGKQYWVVDVGKFEKTDSEDAKKIKDEIRGMRYEGIDQFKDAFFIQR